MNLKKSFDSELSIGPQQNPLRDSKHRCLNRLT